jgi:hypothetical protein
MPGLGDLLRTGELVDRDDERRVGHDPRHAVAGLGQPLQRPQAVLVARLADLALELAAAALVEALGPAGQLLVDLGARVEHVDRPHAGEAVHRLLVADDRRPGRVRALRGTEVLVAPGDLGADREPLDVPLPRARQRLVEVVDVEDHPAVRGREAAEVADVGVAAQLDDDAAGRRPDQVGRHDGRRPAQERERRHGHPLVADRDEPRDARLVLGEHDGDGVDARVALPVPVRAPRRELARVASTLRAVGRRRGRLEPRPGHGGILPRSPPVALVP